MTNQNEVLASLHDIIAANRQYTTWTVSTPHLVMLWEKAQELEREACAKVCDALANDVTEWAENRASAMDIADAIRARGQA